MKKKMSKACTKEKTFVNLESRNVTPDEETNILLN
jgi:hypothetical protein